MPILDQFFSTADFNLSRSIAQVPEAFDQKLHPMNAPALARVSAYSGTDSRPHVKGKFIFLGDDKFYVRGVTYGPFCPNKDGTEYPHPDVAERDFAQIIGNGMNAIRTYSVPPRWLLDAAQKQGLRVMVGLPWEQHVTFLDNKVLCRAIKERVRAGVRACAGHPAILCYAIGNEIPAPIVRWHARWRVERFLEELYWAAKAEEAAGLFTYVNYPTTEYLQLPFLDLVCFNVYLESPASFEAYLARLQNIAGDRPLVMAEIGLDSRRQGESAQADTLALQIRTAFAAGCAGAFVFSWTDEWHRGGHDIADWDFGVTSRDRHPKPALATIRKAFTEVPFATDVHRPRISVVVCTHNGERTIGRCLEGLLKLNYPNFEVIVVDDGSTDKTSAIAREYGFRLISTENRGLGAARNLGLEAATGEIIAYIDDDTYPDPDWLMYLSDAFLTTDYSGVGGPNIPPLSDGLIAQCVANSPGAPVHVLLSDREAEHIPGCNMAFRKSCLETIGGFDPQFRAAGDDVDVCWRLQERGWTLGFNPAAVVWHHRRNSVRAFWKQQKNYGKAEGLLKRKWPEKYNATGHVTWAGRIYNNGFDPALSWSRGRIYQGTSGSAAYQRLYHPRPATWEALLLMPEWYLVCLTLGALCAIGVLWTPLLFVALPLLGLALGLPLLIIAENVCRARFPSAPRGGLPLRTSQLLTTFLHILQPLARLVGRLCCGRSRWRGRGLPGFSFPRPRTFRLWSECWQASNERLRCLEAALRANGMIVRRGGDYNDWDLELQGGMLGHVRLRMAIEEHGAGKQLVRIRSWSKYLTLGFVLTAVFAALSSAAAVDLSWAACAILGIIAALLALFSLLDTSAATAAVCRILKESGFGET